MPMNLLPRQLHIHLRNCHSLFAHGRTDMEQFVTEVVAEHDFIALFETRSTDARNVSLDWEFRSEHSQYSYLHSDIDQYNGGIGLLIKEALLNCFQAIYFSKDWMVVQKARAGCLQLPTPYGTLHIYICYFDPASRICQHQNVHTLADHIEANVHLIVIGNFNYAQTPQDHFVKASGCVNMGDSRGVNGTWTRLFTSKAIHQ